MGAVCSVPFEWRFFSFLQRRSLHFIIASSVQLHGGVLGSHNKHLGAGNDTVITGFMTSNKKREYHSIERSVLRRFEAGSGWSGWSLFRQQAQAGWDGIPDMADSVFTRASGNGSTQLARTTGGSISGEAAIGFYLFYYLYYPREYLFSDATGQSGHRHNHILGGLFLLSCLFCLSLSFLPFQSCPLYLFFFSSRAIPSLARGKKIPAWSVGGQRGLKVAKDGRRWSFICPVWVFEFFPLLVIQGGGLGFSGFFIFSSFTGPGSGLFCKYT